MTIPFVTRNAVVFECHSGTLCVGDLANEPARYVLSAKGILYLPASAIVSANEPATSFAVDNSQMFLIDSSHYDEVAAAVTAHGAVVPNHLLYAALRAKHNTHFGYVVAGELFDTAFDGDGIFALDLSQLGQGVPELRDQGAVDVRELLRRIVSQMNTLVCASCLSIEIMSHPKLGWSPTGRGKKKREWSLAMADHALDSGWTAVLEEGSFGAITPLCPACKKQRQ